MWLLNLVQFLVSPIARFFGVHDFVVVLFLAIGVLVLCLWKWANGQPFPDQKNDAADKRR